MDKKLHDEIAKVAYDLYEKRGRVEGRHDEDWREAEKIVMARYAGAEAVKSHGKGSAADVQGMEAARPVRKKASGKKTAGTAAKKGAKAKKTE